MFGVIAGKHSDQDVESANIIGEAARKIIHDKKNHPVHVAEVIRDIIDEIFEADESRKDFREGNRIIFKRCIGARL